MLYRDVLRTEFLIRGEPILYWQYAGHCPCYDEVSGLFDTSDPLCGGTGLLHLPVDVSAYLALVTGFNTRTAYSRALGALAEGDIVISAFPDEIPLGEQDLVVVPSRARGATEQVTRGAGPSDPLRQPRATAIDSITAQAGPVAPALYAVQADALGNSSVVWAAGGPAAGSRYAVRYRYTPTFVVAEGTLTERRPDPNGDSLPVRAGAKLRNRTETDSA